MNNFSLIYVIQRFFVRIFDFFFHWYVEGVGAIWSRFKKTFFDMDQTIALRITLRHLFEPLYKDYSPVGRIIGPIFRVGRILFGVAFYAVLFAFFFVIMAAWVAVPIFVMVNIIHPIF